MKILKQASFNDNLKSILYYIASSNPQNAKKFKNELYDKVNDLIHMPYKFRKSIYFDNENIRDLIFKGYTIPYKIDIEKNTITIIGINKYKNDL